MASTNSSSSSGAEPRADSFTPETTSTNSNPDVAYPPQRHAGKVGYGPAYHAGPTLGEKMKGYEEELKGHLTHNHALVEHGREMVSGELKRKEHERDLNDAGPFSQTNSSSIKPGGDEEK